MNLDPRANLMILGCISMSAIFIKSPLYLTILFVVTLFILALMRISVLENTKILKAGIVLIVPLFFVQCIFERSGEALLSVGGVEVLTSGGLMTAINMALRILIIVSSALIVTRGERRDYLLALVQCKMPYEMAFMVMTGIHFLPILQSEAMDVLYAVQMKGTDLKRISFSKRLSVYSKLLLPILAGALERAKAMATAMEVRGFRAFETRTYMRRITLDKWDWAVILIFPLLTLASMFFISQ